MAATVVVVAVAEEVVTRMRSKTIALRWPCVFTGSHVREEVDPKVKVMFQRARINPSWGDMRRSWRIKHCAEINPYGSEDCPFSEGQCAQAFLDAVTETVRAKPRKFGALFRFVAHRTGQERADAAQGSRHRSRLRRGQVEGYDPALGQPAEVVQHPSGRRSGVAESVPSGTGEPVRGTDTGPVGLGTLLGSLDLGPRTSSRRGDEGEESTE